MAGADVLLQSLHGIASRLADDMSEKDVENAFLNEDFYENAGYEGAGRDLRSEWTLPDHRRPDYVTLDQNESVTAVYEFKTTGRDLDPHRSQLFHYVEELKADYGVLTNGDRLVLFKRDETSTPYLEIRLAEATESDARNLYSALRKPEWDITDPERVRTYVADLDPVALNGQLGQDHFFDTFRLEDGSPFADLVSAMMDLLSELRDERNAKFVTGAYDFWEASYASEPDDVPDAWDSFVNGRGSLHDFMFCLESGHALLSRLLLAKACEDRDFFPPNTGLNEYFRELQGFGDRIDLDAYPVAASGLLEEMREHLVESLFEDDIFVWWTDGYSEDTASLHGDPYRRFRTVAERGSRGERVSPATRERFSRAVANCFFAVVKFDMAAVEGDPLGDLYQRYFDPETRKALGEFYTPQEVVEYIMDGVEYDQGVSAERLMDPACGSGTFLVEAVSRYLNDVRRYDEDPDWEQHLRALCTRPHVVGLDIHPFAVLMAQIRFMIAILPEYREAKRKNPQFTLRRLPIFRTDTLRNERASTGIDIGESGDRQLTWDAVTESNQDVYIPIPLPIEVDDTGSGGDGAGTGDGDPGGRGVETEDGFLVQRVRMPKFDTIKLATGVANFGEYFAALQGVLDVVKWHMAENAWEYGGGLEEGIGRYTSREYDGIEAFFEPYVNEILDTVRYLREDHGDGRLFKMFEDSVLALVVKNYMDYEYVVGNPPYVNIKNIPDQDQKYYQELYDSAFGRFDLYVLFIERGLGWLSEDGTLGFITSNKFTRSMYGREIRRMISESYTLAEYVDFGDTGIFEDAVNYPCIILVGRNEGRESVNYVKTHRQVDNVLDTIENYLGQDTLTDSLEASSFPLSELGSESWTLTPKPVRDISSKIEDHSQTDIGTISLGIRQGVAPGRDEAFVVSGETVTERDLEEDVLYPIIRGEQTRRWKVLWDGDMVIYPYDDQGKYIGVEQYPNIKSHLDKYEEELRSRFCVQERGRELYGYDEHRPKSVFEGDIRIAVPDMASENHFAHPDGYVCFKNSVYVLTFPDSIVYSQDELLGFLNSSVSEIIMKQISPPLRGRPYRYRYKSQYIENIPLPESSEQIVGTVSRLFDTEELSRSIENFPQSYLNNFTGELEYIDYEWKTARRPVNASIQSLADGGYAVEAGRTDSIRDPRMDSEVRARYVHSAVDGRNVKKGEEVSIPIPRRDADVEALLEDLEADRQAVAETDIEALETEIDEIVYDLFELTEEERQVIEDFLEVF